MSPRSLQRGLSRPGLLAALLVAVLCFGAVVYFMVFGSSGRSDGLSDQLDDVPSITDALRDAEAGGGVTLDYADRDDPSRRAAQLKADEFRPAQVDGRIEPHVYALKGVNARVFLKSGETVLIESESGRMYMPDRSAGPESGSLSGNPKITLFPPPGQAEEPVLVATFEQELRFNFNYAHVETPGKLTVTSRDLDFVGNHVTARLNQPQQRIDVLEVERGEYLRYTPPPAEAKPAAAAPNSEARARPQSRGQAPRIRRVSTQTGQSAPATPPSAPEPAHVALYLATFTDGVTVTQGERTLTADMLETWTRLIDHKLPDRTSAPNPGGGVSNLSALGALVLAAVQDAPGQSEPPAAAPALVLGSDDEPVTLRWTGPLRIVPLVNQPETLARDDLYLRFTAVKTGLVHFGEGPSTGHAASLDYAGTREQLVLTGPGGSVRLESQGQGWLESSRTLVRMNEGTATVVGPGQVFGAAHDPAGPAHREQYVRWLDQADFVFERDAEGRMTGNLRRATFAGQARAVDDARRAEGSVLIADFVESDAGSRLVSRIELHGANVSDGDGGTLAAQRMVVPFETSSSARHDPTSIDASGDVFISKDGKSIASQSLSARILRDANDQLTATDVVAERGVHYVEGEQIDATAERLEASGLDQIAILVGEEGSPARIDYEDSVIVGPRIEMQQHPQRGTVVGPGTFDAADESGTMHAAWGTGLSFDRDSGVLELFGTSRIDQTLASGERRQARGEHLIVELVPVGEELALEAASIFGGVDTPGVVEVRRTAADTGEPTEMLHIESSELMTMDGGTALVASRPGRLVVLDRRVGGDADLEGWDRGHALFTWQQSLVVDRLRGEAHLRGDAQVIHRAMDGGRTAELAGDVIDATFLETEDTQPEVTMVVVTGTAYARVDQQEVLAARLEFDTTRQIVYAVGTDSEPVRSIDGATGAVVSAKSLTWNLRTDRIEIDKPSPFVMPRNP
ncbi:MAG: hypothetical protein DYG94_11095 [Leptolyngbya sp. PLA3]|nr:MAG: hypothetical protein EDM82_10005 [Cyanobacteria bacterium CYA]MCE7969274.1 hypothetical protein [Leptolyngbya sp. PL-A3]